MKTALRAVSHHGQRTLVGLLLICAGAATAGPLPVSGARGHVQCPLASRDPVTWVIDRETDWRALQPVTSGDEALGRPVRWSRERLLIHSIGLQPTLGHSVRLAGTEFTRLGARQLGLRIEVRHPAPDEMAATALSSPCLVVAVPRGRWRSVQLLDADGVPLGAPLPLRAGEASGAAGVAAPR